MKNKIYIIGLICLTILVVVGTYFFNKKTNNTITNKTTVTTNYSNFYTVNSCINRYITYLSESNSKSLYLLLNSSYKKNNNITEKNILSKLDTIDSDSIYVSTKMYEESLGNSLTKYYVNGYIQKNELLENTDTSSSKSNYYLIVYLDKNNKTFSIEPYNGKIFEKGDNNE